MSVNKVTLLGFLGRDPEFRALQSGQKLATVSLATAERWTDKQTGEVREKAEWHAVVLWGVLAELVTKHLKKGARLYVEGKLETRKWQDQGGQDRYSTEIHVRPGNGVLEMLGEKSPKPADGKTSQAPASDRYADDIPF